MNEVTSRLFFSTVKVALASGIEPAVSALVGPGLAGLIVITPSIPDAPAGGVWPEQTAAHMMRNIKTVETPANFTTKFIGTSLVAQQKRET
jgi:hypothetical protein